jgi:hypothetical protein
LTAPAMPGQCPRCGHQGRPEAKFCTECGDNLAASAGEARPGRVIATDYPNLQAAVNALPDRTGEVYLPPGEYVLEKTLDLSYPPGGYQGGIKLVGAGRRSRIIGKTRGQPVIDLTGANHCLIQDLNIEYEEGNPEVAPNVGLLLARNPDGGSAQEHRFTNVNLIGYFSVANVYNITSELDRFIGCIFINKAPGGHNLVWSSDNFAHVESPSRGRIRTLYSNTELRVIGCSFYNWGGGEGGSNVHLRGFTMDATVRDCYMNPPQGGHAVYLGMSSQGGPVRDAEFTNLRIEGENATDVFRIEGRAENVAIRHCCLIYGEGRALNADAVSYLAFEHNDVWNVRGWKTAIRAESLSESRIVSNLFTFDNWEGKNPQAGPEVVITGTHSARNLLQVPDRRMVVYQNLEGTVIDAPGEEGTHRLYLGEYASGVTLNLTPVNTAALKGPKKGDLALDDGTNTASKKPGLAVFDGAAWQYALTD